MSVNEPGYPLVELDHVSVLRGTAVLLSDITWTLSSGENWAVLGANGAGKTTFLKLVRGDIWPSPGCGNRFYRMNGVARTGPIGFREKTGIVSPELLVNYKQNAWNIKALDVVLSGFFDTVYLHQEPTEGQRKRTHEVIASLGLEDLVEKDFLSLSLGQAKKILIARAIVHEPSLLILDEVTTGLDSQSKTTMLETIGRLAENGTQVLCAAHAPEDLPDGITDVLHLDGGRIVAIRSYEEMPSAKGKTGAHPMAPSPPESSASSQGTPLIAIENANVFRKGKRVLNGIDWVIQPGENWAVLGRNGSGKTTLLRLLCGDLPSAWGGTIRRFGNENAHTLWEIRQNISLVSADLQAWHDCPQTGLDTVVSGFFGSIGVHDPVRDHQVRAAWQWLAEYDLEELGERDIQTLSYGQLRMLLILRAMVTNPTMLLLDEPLSGLDSDMGARVLNLLDSLAARGIALVYVTHKMEELPRSITRALVLKDGTVDFCGDVEALGITSFPERDSRCR